MNAHFVGKNWERCRTNNTFSNRLLWLNQAAVRVNNTLMVVGNTVEGHPYEKLYSNVPFILFAVVKVDILLNEYAQSNCTGLKCYFKSKIKSYSMKEERDILNKTFGYTYLRGQKSMRMNFSESANRTPSKVE